MPDKESPHSAARQSEEAIFAAALQIDERGERDRYVREACRDDPRLLQSVQQLLAAHGRPDSLLDSPPTSEFHVPIRETAGTRIGPYKLLQQIGEGGFGVVFMAEQMKPIRRKVALKIVKPGMDTREVVARFEAERQALAMMDHPNIAKVLDAGATDSGRPYFVMELVKGIPITTYCDHNSLSTTARLELFILVCRAVQHAHQKGVIHRDIKPNNVLVTLHDGTAVPKIIDFGIAKALSQPLTEKTLFTQFGQVVGTPQYMSPEQAELSGLDVDTRSDIYSLGVLLYELLTGRTPFDAKTLRQAGLDEMRRMIREDEPPRPSERVRTLDAETATTVASARATVPLLLSKLFRGELDWIVMKSLDKDRGRRYESAQALARDVERHLHEEPVEAAAPSTLYRIRKAIRRHKVASATTAAVAIALLLGAAAASFGFYRARQARNASEAAYAALETETRNRRLEAQKSELMVTMLTELLAPTRPHQGRGINYLAVQLLDEFEQTLTDRLQDHVEVHGNLRITLARAYRFLGRRSDSQQQVRHAVELHRAAFGRNHPRTLETMFWAGRLLPAREALDVLRDRLQIQEQSDADAVDLIATHNELAENYRIADDPQAAERHVRLAARLDPEELDLWTLTTALRRQGRLDEAIQTGESGIREANRELGPDSTEAVYWVWHHGKCFVRKGQFADAVRRFRPAVAMARNMSSFAAYWAEKPLIRAYQINHNRSTVIEELEVTIGRLEGHRAAHSVAPDNLLNPQLAEALWNSSRQRDALGHHEEGRRYAERALDVLLEILPDIKSAGLNGYGYPGNFWLMVEIAASERADLLTELMAIGQDYQPETHTPSENEHWLLAKAVVAQRNHDATAAADLYLECYHTMPRYAQLAPMADRTLTAYIDCMADAGRGDEADRTLGEIFAAEDRPGHEVTNAFVRAHLARRLYEAYPEKSDRPLRLLRESDERLRDEPLVPDSEKQRIAALIAAIEAGGD